MHNVYKNIEKYYLGKKRKALIVFVDMVADMISCKKRHPVVIEILIRLSKLNIPLVFITQPYFPVPKDIRLNTTHFFLMKISSKRELQHIATNHSSDIDTKSLSRS